MLVAFVGRVSLPPRDQGFLDLHDNKEVCIRNWGFWIQVGRVRPEEPG